MIAGKKISLITLGCPKNEADSDVLAGLLKQGNPTFVSDPEQADIILINTCGFIEDAKQESINTILEVGEVKKHNPNARLYVWGCLSQRYKEEIKQEFPEVDGFFGVEPFEEMGRHFLGNFHWQESCYQNRILSTPSHTAYLKIADGCNHQCTFCAIPTFKGSNHSRSMQSVVDEARMLADQGARELHLVAQDTTAYGLDLGPDVRLPALLESLCRIDGIDWIRILYAHPLHVNTALMDVMASEEKICSYLDMPLQHASDAMLKAMGRGHGRKDVLRLIDTLRSRIPRLVLRTAFILGFPGETDDDYQSLLDLVQTVRFERLGAFLYSAEEGTPAFALKHTVKRDVAIERYNLLMDMQQTISEEKNAQYENQIVQVLVDGFDEDQDCYFGRTSGDALDVDQTVWIQGDAHIGQIEKVKIEFSSAYDLEGRVYQP